jgi:arginine exporter protein ArgO
MSEYFAIIDGFNLTVTAIVAVGSQLIFGVATYALKKEYL